MQEKIPCPHCGELNILGSNICGGCLKDIRKIANPEREDLEQTAKTPHPKGNLSLFRRLKRWWDSRGRRAE